MAVLLSRRVRWSDALERVSRFLGSAMQQAVVACLRLHRFILFGVGWLLVFSGCVSTSASGYAGGFALTLAECDPTDSTVTCCLKQNPGQYERCGATPPAEATRPNYLPPGIPESEASPIPELPTAEDKERWRTDICEPHYVKCLRAGGTSSRAGNQGSPSVKLASMPVCAMGIGPCGGLGRGDVAQPHPASGLPLTPRSPRS